MLDRSWLITLLLTAGLVLGACGDDDNGNNNPQPDIGQVNKDQGQPKQDGKVVSPDKGAPTGCLAKCTAEKPYFCVETTVSGKSQCVECTQDSHCKNNPNSLGATCDTTNKICTCTKDVDCSGKSYGTKCDTANKMCSCAGDSNCQAPQKCLGSLFGAKVCAKACTKDLDCANSTYKKCDTASGKCVACKIDADCTSSTAKFCSTSLGKCVACKADANCTSATAPFCDGATGKCAACKTDLHCAKSLDGGKCVSGSCSCAANADCKTGYTWGDTCDTTTLKRCKCTANSGCAGNANGPTCYTTYNKCSCASDAACKTAPLTKCIVPYPGATYKNCQKPCAKDADCSSGTYKKCDVPTGRCVGCKVDADCTSSSAKYCSLAVGKCVACKTDAQCTNKATPFCDGTGMCAECAKDANCTGYVWGNKCVANSTYGSQCRCSASTDCTNNANGPTCYATYSKCSCASDAECKTTPYTKCKVPYANATYKHCQISCKTNADCSSSTTAKACKATSGDCVQCATNNDCKTLYTATYPWYRVCDATANTCDECAKSADCDASSLGNTCDTQNAICVCAKDADCATNTNGKKCDTSAKACSCLVDGDCLGGKKCTGSTPFSTKYCK